MKNDKGFTIFFAVLVASLALAVGLSIYDLIVRELQLSQIATQSQYAIYAADTGAECALYWDLEYYKAFDSSNPNHTAFATSTDYASGRAGAGQAVCNGQDITAANSYISNTTANGNTGWDINAPDTTHATTTFYISLGANAVSPCAKVEVGKAAANVGDPPQTTIISHGYNTCSPNINRLERALQVNY